MKIHKILFTITLIVMMISAAGAVSALSFDDAVASQTLQTDNGATIMSEPAEPSGYWVTNNYHGHDEVPIGADIYATAFTTDTNVIQVTFRWNDPFENVARQDVVSTFSTQIIDGVTVRVFEAPVFNPDQIGKWGVQAFFQGEGGNNRAGLEMVIEIRATSFGVIPEIPLIGTAGVAIAMMLGIAYKTRRKTRA
jgi:hypothetical protein